MKFGQSIDQEFNNHAENKEGNFINFVINSLSF